MKLDKEEVRRPDLLHVMADSVSNWISKNRPLVWGSFSVVIILLTSWIGYDYFSSRAELRALESLYLARKQLNPSLVNPFAQPSPDKPKFTAEIASSFEAVLREHKNSFAAGLAAIELSQAYLDQGNKENALKTLEGFGSSDKPSRNIITALIFLQKAKVLESNNKCDQAILLLEKIWSSEGVLKAFQNEARLRAGICYEQMSQFDKAKEMYTAASQEKGAAADSAKKYLRLLKPQSS